MQKKLSEMKTFNKPNFYEENLPFAFCFNDNRYCFCSNDLYASKKAF